MKVIESFINELNIGEALNFDKLIIKPIFAHTDYQLPFLTLEEALNKDVLEITEIDEDGNVPELLVKNTGEQDIIVLEGEELRGAKQNRIVNTTVIIPATSEIVLPVSCVERGRWDYVSEQFSSGESVLYPSLRQKSHGQVTENLRLYKTHQSDQGEIWADIEEKSKRLEIDTDTDAMSDILDTSITPDAEVTLLDEVKHQEKQIGFLAFIDGGFAGADIFGSTELCKKQLKKLMRGYYMDALDQGVEFPKLESEEILIQITDAQHEQFETIGKGSEMRFENEKIQGAWKLVDENVSHLTIFPKS